MASEKLLIDANEAYEAVIDLSGQADTKSAYAAFWKAGKEIQKLPTVDAVEVVRCEKCLYRSQYADENGNYKCGGIQTEDGSLALMVKPDFFCAYGERRNNG